MDTFVTLDSSLDNGATFRFPVTWSYLSGASTPGHQTVKAVRPIAMPAPPPVKFDPPPAPRPVESVATTMEVVTSRSNPALKSVGGVPPQSGMDAKWEMVIPKMTRPATPARQQRSLEKVAPPSPTPAASVSVPAAQAAPNVSFYAGSEASFVPRRWKMLSLGAAVLLVGGVIALVRPSDNSISESGSAPAAAGTWSRRTAYLVGGKDAREILIYSGSEDVKNYRIEFAWIPDTRGVGWLFRGTDSANYYAAKLRLMQSGATPTLSAEHFSVVKGVEGPHSRKVLTLGRTLGQVLVRMDANGPAFTLYLQGSPADYWTDERFESGSLGFYSERGERPNLQSLRFTFFKKSGLQTVVTSLQ